MLNEALADCVRRWLAQLSEAARAPPGQTLPENPVGLVLDAIAENQPLAVAYLEAWAQAVRAPQLREQLASHYREFREATAALARHTTIAAGEPAIDLQAIASLIIAVADGLMVQSLLDPDGLDPQRLRAAATTLQRLCYP
ncbi:MAG: TetR family transcriptional regulator C-terminal domain-containing protein [Solirubrobacteraceae bacterium]